MKVLMAPTQPFMSMTLPMRALMKASTPAKSRLRPTWQRQAVSYLRPDKPRQRERRSPLGSLRSAQQVRLQRTRSCLPRLPNSMSGLTTRRVVFSQGLASSSSTKFVSARTCSALDPQQALASGVQSAGILPT